MFKKPLVLEAVLVNNVEEAEHCLNNCLHVGRKILTTHSSPEVYLREIHGLDASCLSRWLDDEVMWSLREGTTDFVDGAIKELDKEVSSKISDQTGHDIDHFQALYSYLGKYQYLGYAAFGEALERAKTELNIGKIYFYNFSMVDFFASGTDLEKLVKTAFPGLALEKIDHPEIVHSRPSLLTRILRTLVLGLKNPVFLRTKISQLLAKKQDAARLLGNIDGKKRILLSEDLFDLAFLRGVEGKYNFIYYEAGAAFPAGIRAVTDENQKVSFTAGTFSSKFVDELSDDVQKLFASEMLGNLERTLPGHISALKHLDEYLIDKPVELAIWGNPPIEGIKALLFAILKKRGIKILGAQHGCVYGEAYEPWHFDSDFNRCDDFLSYGFTEGDLRDLYPDDERRIPVIHPVGMKSAGARVEKRKKEIDIVFPITSTLSFFRGGISRLQPHMITERQIEILRHLNSLTGLKITVKPFLYSDNWSCSVFPILKEFKNLSVVDDMTFTEFMQNYSPKITIIEYPSQPLYDAICYDTEIFLMDDFMHPYTDRALRDLVKRVHFESGTASLIKKLDLYLKGDLESKRDRTFQEHYVIKSDREANILNIIDDLIGGE